MKQDKTESSLRMENILSDISRFMWNFVGTYSKTWNAARNKNFYLKNPNPFCWKKKCIAHRFRRKNRFIWTEVVIFFICFFLQKMECLKIFALQYVTSILCRLCKWDETVLFGVQWDVKGADCAIHWSAQLQEGRGLVQTATATQA